MDKKKQIVNSLKDLFEEVGFEIYPFKIGWYNEQVNPHFHFDLDPDTLAFIILSTPDMFEKALVPFICREECLSSSMDHLDRCMKHYFNLARQYFPEEDIETIHDFEMTTTRRPKILVQPAGHVAGAAYYYTRWSLNHNPFGEKKIFGVSMHPKYGGWFALRGVIIFKSVQCLDLPKKEPVDCLPNEDKKVELLQLFNYHWQDWRFRDLIQVKKSYSEDQKLYFQTLPKDRQSLVLMLKEKYCSLDKEKAVISYENINTNDTAVVHL